MSLLGPCLEIPERELTLARAKIGELFGAQPLTGTPTTGLPQPIRSPFRLPRLNQGLLLVVQFSPPPGVGLFHLLDAVGVPPYHPSHLSGVVPRTQPRSRSR